MMMMMKKMDDTVDDDTVDDDDAAVQVLPHPESPSWPLYPYPIFLTFGNSPDVVLDSKGK